MDTVPDTSITPEDCYRKLEKLKDIRQKTIQIEKMKISIKDSMQEAEEERKSLEEYKKEINLLLQEKMAHVEELRLIHTDINTMESLIKQSSMDRNNMINEAQKLLEQYKPLKCKLDAARQEIGLEKTADFLEEEPNLLTEITNDRDVSLLLPEKLVPMETTLFSNDPQEKLQLVAPDNKHASHPPPMKVCLSCHQQIHRNAPICPLCKAKSRSRNPKKPKKPSKSEE